MRHLRRLRPQDTREIEQQRRLQTYDKLEPIFNRLGEKFQFKSADEASPACLPARPSRPLRLPAAEMWARSRSARDCR